MCKTLSFFQTHQLDSEILKHHLKVTKQIIILLDLTPGGFPKSHPYVMFFLSAWEDANTDNCRARKLRSIEATPLVM